jgi:hypothetical protein
MPRTNGARVTATIAINSARAAALVLIDAQPDCAHDWREVAGWIDAAANDLRVSLSAEGVPAPFATDTARLAQYLDAQLALAASLVDSLAIGEAQRASEHAQRRAATAPPGGPVRSGHGASDLSPQAPAKAERTTNARKADR